MTSRRPTAATTTETPLSSGDGGSVTFLHSNYAGSQTLSSRPAEKPATNSAPTVIRPSDAPDMSLTEAAYWIATEGESREFELSDADAWKSAFAQLLKAIVDGKVAVLGRRAGDGFYEKVPSDYFRRVNISYPYCGHPSDFAAGSDPYLQCWGILDEEYSRNGFDDKLFVRRLQLEWGHLRVGGTDVACHWPFAEAQQGQRRGRTMAYDWEDVRKYVFQVMNEKREFKEWDTDDNWKCQADLEKLVADYMGKWKKYPSESTIRGHTKKFLAEWRSGASEADN